MLHIENTKVDVDSAVGNRGAILQRWRKTSGREWINGLGYTHRPFETRHPELRVLGSTLKSCASISAKTVLLITSNDFRDVDAVGGRNDDPLRSTYLGRIEDGCSGLSHLAGRREHSPVDSVHCCDVCGMLAHYPTCKGLSTHRALFDLQQRAPI
jgi:hypothetical protein